MIFGIEIILSTVCNLQEVLEHELVAEVLVKVILEMLEQVHVLLNKFISSNSWEGECLVVEFPCMNANLGVETLILELTINLHCFLVMLSIEVS